MPVLRLYLHGLTAGIPPTTNTHERRKRGKVQGWTHRTTRSNTRFLYAVEPGGLTGYGYALSLTLRDCPPTAEDFHRVRRAFFEAMRRLGMIRLHWLIEWQRRGVPHLHAALWLPGPGMADEIVQHWCRVAKRYGALKWGQHVTRINNEVGWFKYLSKHAARGVSHYQRAPESIPKGWKDGTGRMWGSVGDWPLREAMELNIDKRGYDRLRRIVRGWRVADARRAMENGEGTRRLRSARRMLRSNDPNAAAVRGVSEWIPLESALQAVTWLASEGCKVSDGTVVSQ